MQELPPNSSQQVGAIGALTSPSQHSSPAPIHTGWLTDGAPQCQSVLECLAGALSQEWGAHVGGIPHQGNPPMAPHLGGKVGGGRQRP